MYADPIGYWRNYYNLFDFFVLCVSAVQTILANIQVTQSSATILKVIRGRAAKFKVPLLRVRTFFHTVLRTVRILRSVSFIRGLQVLVTALLDTFLNAMVPLLFLLFILMFIFSVVGYYWFGFDQNGDKENWGTFGRAMLSLFTFVTVSEWMAGWTPLARFDRGGGAKRQGEMSHLRMYKKPRLKYSITSGLGTTYVKRVGPQDHLSSSHHLDNLCRPHLDQLRVDQILHVRTSF